MSGDLIVLDGGLGGELIRRGWPSGGLWSAKALVEQPKSSGMFMMIILMLGRELSLQIPTLRYQATWTKAVWAIPIWN